MKIIYYPKPKEDIDYTTDKNDIRNFTNDNMIRAYNEEYDLNCYIVQGKNENYHLKVYLDDMREINFNSNLIIDRYNLPRIVYLGNEEYYYRKKIFDIDAYEKLVEKYNDLTREALSNGDKILSENYLQHSEHFSRILISQENSRNQSEKESGSNISNQVKVETENKESEDIITK